MSYGVYFEWSAARTSIHFAKKSNIDNNNNMKYIGAIVSWKAV